MNSKHQPEIVIRLDTPSTGVLEVEDWDELNYLVTTNESVLKWFEKGNKGKNLSIISCFKAALDEWAAHGFGGQYNFYTAKMTIEPKRQAKAIAGGNDPWATNYNELY